MQEPNFSSVGAVLCNWPGGMEVVKPPRFGFGRIAVFELGLLAVVLGVVGVFRLAINRSLVTGSMVPSILTEYLFDSSSLLLALCSPTVPVVVELDLGSSSVAASFMITLEFLCIPNPIRLRLEPKPKLIPAWFVFSQLFSLEYVVAYNKRCIESNGE
jgi:hypothetical protein